MIDTKALIKDFDLISEKIARKGVSRELIVLLKEVCEELKEQKISLEALQETQNKESKLFPLYQKEGKDINELKDKLAKNKEDIAKQSEVVKTLDEKLYSIALNIPNIADDDVPDGLSEDDNIEIKKVLMPKEFKFTPKEHFDLEAFIDFERGVKLSKSRFSVLSGKGAKLYRALINYMLDFNASRGFHEYTLPYIANVDTLMGTGQLPKFEDDLFKIDGENLYLIPTSEVMLVNLYRDEILDSKELPLKVTSYTECFRKEAGSAGKDTRGMIRQHQFGKVELVAITKPAESEQVFAEMVQTASDLLTSLELPHRWLSLCTGDLGFGATKTIDLEVWLPGQNRYREISSVSNTRDFQARRAKIRFKDGKKNELVHTLNGSSLAVGRCLIAIMENYQNADGSVSIPKVLEKYM